MTSPAFSARDLVRLERTLRVLLHPTADSPLGWLMEACESVRELTDAAVVTTAIAGEGGAPRFVSPHLDQETLRPYQEHWYHEDFVVRRMMERPAAVSSLVEVADRREVLASPLRNEFIKKQLGLDEPMIVKASIGPVDGARILTAYETFLTEDQATTKSTLLRAIVPAFTAGVAAWGRLTAAHAGMRQLLDTVGGAAAVCDLAGRVLHANAGMTDVLAGAGGALVRREAESMARSIASLAPGRAPGFGAFEPVVAKAMSREVATAAGRYRLRATFAGEGVLGAEPRVIVAVESIGALAQAPLTDAEVQARFGLTERETEIARLMAEGLGNKEIAGRLGLSFYTARNHAERVMAKLGAEGRGRVGPILRSGAATA